MALLPSAALFFVPWPLWLSSSFVWVGTGNSWLRTIPEASQRALSGPSVQYATTQHHPGDPLPQGPPKWGDSGLPALSAKCEETSKEAIASPLFALTFFSLCLLEGSHGPILLGRCSRKPPQESNSSLGVQPGPPKELLKQWPGERAFRQGGQCKGI